MLVADGATTLVSRVIVVRCSGSPVRVQISLAGTDDTIGYWTRCRKRPTT
jgi:hypothetical protein